MIPLLSNETVAPSQDNCSYSKPFKALPNSFDMFIPRRKRVVQFIPLLVGLEISSALATGSAGVGVAISTYNKLSQQLIDDVNMVYQSVRALQDQVDSLAEVVLQNRRGLDLLTADKGVSA